MSYWNSHGSFYVEGFNPEKQHFILLGDSVFKNDVYVANGKSVDVLLKEKTNGETTTLAVNDSIISDVYYQLDKIPDSLKSRSASVKVYKNTTIFLSVGGNDILAQFDEKNKEFDIKIIDTIFTAYEKLVKTIQAVMPNAIIVLVDIYYPENIKYKKYHKIIETWNEKLDKFARENNFELLQISLVLTLPEDFTFDIEPSAIGSEKIVDAIMKSF